MILYNKYTLFICLLHHFSFETPTLEGVLLSGAKENGDTFSALEMRKGV